MANKFATAKIKCSFEMSKYTTMGDNIHFTGIDRCTYNNATKHEKGMLLLLSDIFYMSRSCKCLVNLYQYI